MAGGTASPTVFARIDLRDNDPIRLGNSQDARIVWDTNDADANALLVDVPAGGATDVPAFAVGIGLIGTDLGMFNGLTQPFLGIVDADRDTYLGLSMSADDAPVVRMRVGVAGTVRNHTLPDVASDTFVLLDATQTLTNKTFTDPVLNLTDNVTLNFGTGNPAQMLWDTTDTNANALFVQLPTGGAVDVPVLAVGIGIDGVDLGMFNGLTQPMVATVDADRDSYVGLHFSGDDVAVVRMRLTGAGTVRNHVLPDVGSDTFTLNAATQTLTAKTLTSPIVGTQITLDQATGDYTFTWADPAAARAISIIDPGGTDVFVWRDATQTLLAKTLTSPDINGGTADSLTSLSIRSTGAAFDLLLATATVFGANRTLTIDPGDASRTLTITADSSIGGTAYVVGGTDVALADGGTNASLVANNGGIFYSTATAGAILAGTATAGQMLRSGATAAPTWSTATFPAVATGTGTLLRADGTNWVASTLTMPDTAAISTILYASAANVISALATANSGVLVTSGTGVPSISSTLPAVTLGGTVSGGGNQINNVVIGAVTPLAGTFGAIIGTTIDASVDFTVGGTVITDGSIADTGVLIINPTTALAFGSGEGGTVAATGTTIRAPNITTGGAGNIAGADLTFAAGLGTGTGDVGTLIFQLPVVAAAGDNIQTLATRLTLDMVASTTQLTATLAQGIVWSGGDTFIANGNGLVVGHSALLTDIRGTVAPEFQMLGTGDADTNSTVVRFSADANGPWLIIAKSRTAAIGATRTIVADGDEIGRIAWIPDDGVDLAANAARIRVVVDDASPAADQVGAALIFDTALGAANNDIAEALRLSPAQNMQFLTAVTLAAAAADTISIGGVDQAAGNRMLYIQAEQGSPIRIGQNRVHVGLAGTATGLFELDGATSGTVTLTVAAAAGTWTMTLPTAVGAANAVLTDAAGDGVTSWTTAPNFTGLTMTGNINPEADGTRSLGTQTTAQWANVWSDLINGADFGMANKWRMVESELYNGYGRGWAIGHDDRWQDGRSLWVNPGDVTPDQRPVFAVTDDWLEHQGYRWRPEEHGERLNVLEQAEAVAAQAWETQEEKIARLEARIAVLEAV